MAVLGLDVGEKRIGVAISQSGLVAREWGVIERTAGDQKTIGELAKIVAEVQAQKIVVGLPTNRAGGLTDQAKTIKDFAGHLKKAFSLPIEFEDETGSSQLAEELLLKTRQKKFAKKEIDQLAARIILEQHLLRMN